MSTTIEPRLEIPPAPSEQLPAPLEVPTARRSPVSARNVALGLAVLWLLSGIYLVGPDQQAVVTQFGRVVEERVLPGMHYRWPYPIGQVHKLRTLQRRRAFIGGAAADQTLGQIEPLESQFLSGDRNLIQVRTVVQYSVATPADYLFRSDDVARTVGAAVEAELARQIASRNVDDVLTTEKVAIQETVRQRAQGLVDGYGLGVVLSTVNIEYIAPPPETAAAFRDVASARADSVRIINEAQGYANDLLPRARGEAQKLAEASQAYRHRMINQAQGDASRFTQLAGESRKNPAITRSRLYLEAMEEVLPRLKKTIVDSRSDLDMTIIRRDSPQNKSEAGALPPATTAFPPAP